MADGALFELLTRMGDTTLVLAHRVSEWCGHAPALEEDIALANVALDLIGHTQMWLELAGDVEGEGRSADDLAFLREAHEFRNHLLVERPNGDFGVTFTAEEVAGGEVDYNYKRQGFPSEEAPGLSVFARDESGAVFHTYSTYGRGLDMLIGAYNYLDLVPKGRDEDSLPWPMAWIRHHDRYDQP